MILCLDNHTCSLDISSFYIPCSPEYVQAAYHEKIVGFTIIDQTHVIAKSAIEGWVENKACSIFKSGKIHLRAAKGAKEGENVHVYVSAGKFGQIAGGAADSADGASTVELLGCKWQENVEVGQVGPVVVTNLTYKAS